LTWSNTGPAGSKKDFAVIFQLEETVCHIYDLDYAYNHVLTPSPLKISPVLLRLWLDNDVGSVLKQYSFSPVEHENPQGIINFIQHKVLLSLITIVR